MNCFSFLSTNVFWPYWILLPCQIILKKRFKKFHVHSSKDEGFEHVINIYPMVIWIVRHIHILQRRNVNENEYKKNQTIDSKINKYCVYYLPLRGCVDIYDHCTVFRWDAQGAKICWIERVDDMFGFVQSVEDKDVVLVSLLIFMIFNSFWASSHDKSSHIKVTLTSISL